jgi:hypothetical protein
MPDFIFIALTAVVVTKFQLPGSGGVGEASDGFERPKIANNARQTTNPLHFMGQCLSD